MVGFGGYGVGVGMIAIIMSVIIGFWYAANYEYLRSDYSGEITRAQDPEVQGESLPEASSVATDDDTKSSATVPLGLSSPNPADKPKYGEVQARWTTMVNLMLSRYSSLQAFEERQTTLQPILDVSVDSDNSPMLGSGSTLIGENQPALEITEADFDDKNDESHKDRPVEKTTPKAAAEKGEESERQESDEEQAENAAIDGVIIDELDELIDELEDQGDEILDAVDVADGLELPD